MHRAKIELHRGDLVEPSVEAKLTTGFYNINIYRSRPVVIIDGSKTYRVQTARQSPRQIASTAGLTLYPEDVAKISVVTDFARDGALGNRMVITRALPVAIKVDGKVLGLRIQPTTVRQLLTVKDIKLSEADTVSPGLDQGIVPGVQVNVTRVSEAVVGVSKPLPRPTKTVLDGAMAKGTSKVVQEGSDGHEVVTYRIHYRDGVETARETLKVDGRVEPTPRVVVQGTKIFFSGSIEHWRPYVTEAATARGISPDLMLGIMRCESGGNANASNGSHFGLYQYDWPTWISAGGTRTNIYDGQTQIELTAGKIAREGLRAWAASKFCWSKYQ